MEYINGKLFAVQNIHNDVSLSHKCTWAEGGLANPWGYRCKYSFLIAIHWINDQIHTGKSAPCIGVVWWRYRADFATDKDIEMGAVRLAITEGAGG
jgi:hypothetical protein